MAIFFDEKHSTNRQYLIDTDSHIIKKHNSSKLFIENEAELIFDPNTIDYQDSFEISLKETSGNQSKIIFEQKAGWVYMLNNNELVLSGHFILFPYQSCSITRKLDTMEVFISGSIMPINTFIKGEGVNTSSASELETLMSLSSGQVTYFNLNGNDIEAIIEGSFEISTFTFDGNTDITSFKTTADLTLINNYCFRNCENLIEFIAPLYIGDVRAGSFQNCYALQTFTAKKIYEISNYGFRNCESLTDFDFSSVTATAIGTFQSCILLQEVIAPNLISVSTNSFASCTALTKFHATNLVTAGSNLLFGCQNLTDVLLPLLETTGINLFRDCYSLVSVNLPELTSMGDGCFRTCTSIQVINAPKLTVCGSSTTTENVFSSVATGGTITVNIALQTANGGSPDGDIDYLESSRGWTVIYV